MVERPHPDEYRAFDANYVVRIPPDADIFEIFRVQPDQLHALLQYTGDSQASRRPSAGEWSIKEVVGHVADQERIFAYRCLCIARGDTADFPGYDQEGYVKSTDLRARSLAGLLDEFDFQRRANVLCFQELDAGELSRLGSARGQPVTPQALLYLMAGHVMHHIESLQHDYHVGG